MKWKHHRVRKALYYSGNNYDTVASINQNADVLEEAIKKINELSDKVKELEEGVKRLEGGE